MPFRRRKFNAGQNWSLSSARISKAIKLDNASGRKIEVIMQNIMGNIQEHYRKIITLNEIGGWSWRN
jgi:hypothetical protein